MAFGRIEINHQAITDHGWEPLNRKLLEYPHPLSWKNCKSISYHLEPSSLNVENAEGMAASVIDWIVREMLKNQAAKAVAEK